MNANLKTPSLHSSLAHLHSQFSSPPDSRGKRGLRSVCDMLSLPCLPLQREDSHLFCAISLSCLRLEALALLLMCSALASSRSVLGVPWEWQWLCQRWGCFWQVLTEATPVGSGPCQQSFLEWWLVPQACQYLQDVWTVPLITCFSQVSQLCESIVLIFYVVLMVS